MGDRWKLGVAPALLATTLTGCGDGGGGGSPAPGGTVTTPAPAPSATTPAPAAGFATAAAALYDVAPDVTACRAGTLRPGVAARALGEINAVRALHALAPVAYADADDGEAADASLIMAANLALSHTPPASWACYGARGAAGAASGNLYLGRGAGLGFATSDDHLAAWINEGGAAELGHRRWILDPFLGRVAYGRVTQQMADGNRIDAATLKVFGFTAGRPAPGRVPAFVAVPQGDYPVRYFRAGDYLSFSVAPDPAGGEAAAQVDLSAARVAVTRAGGETLAVSDLTHDNVGYGLANNLQWRVAGLQAGASYDVRITGVRRAPAGEYRYSFRIVP